MTVDKSSGRAVRDGSELESDALMGNRLENIEA
jgi:hypothetical protein